MSQRVARIDHIEIAAPRGCEPAARGGCWFECGSQQVHIGVQPNFQPARKAHPAFAVFDLDDLRSALVAQRVIAVDDDNLPGARRFYAEDPWGNRLEFVEIAR